MPIQPTLRRARSRRSGRSQRLNFPMIGQCFDIEITREADGWMVRIPEIGGVTRAGRRATVEAAAREYIAVRTGIPIGYIAIFVAREIG